MRLIGLCGRSGSGKSSFTRLAQEYGIKTIDCDAVYRDLVSHPSECLSEIAKAFGTSVIENGALNRRVLAPIVFSDKEKLNLLNSITHKHIKNEVYNILRSADEKETFILDAPTLFESGLDKDCHIIVAIVADDRISIERIVKRDGISPEEAAKRLSNQHPMEFFYKNCNYVLENNSSLEDFNTKSRKLLQHIKEEHGEA